MKTFRLAPFGPNKKYIFRNLTIFPGGLYAPGGWDDTASVVRSFADVTSNENEGPIHLARQPTETLSAFSRSDEFRGVRRMKDIFCLTLEMLLCENRHGKALYFAGGAAASVDIASQAEAPLTLYLSKNFFLSSYVFILPRLPFSQPITLLLSPQSLLASGMAGLPRISSGCKV